MYIEGSPSELSEIKIYNSLGQDVTRLTELTEVNEKTYLINISQLNSGLYFLKTKTTANKLYKE